MADSVTRLPPTRVLGGRLLFAPLAAVAAGLVMRWMPVANTGLRRYLVYVAVALIVIVPTSAWRRLREPATSLGILLRVAVFLVIARILEQVFFQ